jgi:hydrogenase-4 component F
MELIYILLVSISAAVLSLIPLGRRFAPGVTILGNLAIFLLSLRTALATAGGGEVIAVRDYLSCDSFSGLILLLVAFVGLAAAFFSCGYIATTVGATDDRKIRRYYSRFNLFLLSMLAVPIFSQLALVWIAVELTTLLSVFLVGFESTPQALEAAWKYAVLTCMGASLALIGILLLCWGLSATPQAPFTWAGLLSASPRMSPALLYTAFLFILIGFGTKAGLVPMHTWLPDAHSQAPSPICAILSGIETTAVLYCIIRLLPLFPGGAASEAGKWFVIFGLISAGVAAFLLIQTKDYKRLFAFSTVEHMGIILVAAGLGGFAAHLGAMMQIVSHTVTKSLCFFAAGTTLMATGTRSIGAIRGLIRISPVAAIFLLVGGLSIAGAPPSAVFLSEFSILKAGIINGQYLVIGLLAFFIGVAFFGIMQQINRMVFGSADIILMDNRTQLFGRAILSQRNTPPLTCILALVITLIPAILFGIYLPEPFYQLLHQAAALLGGSK